MKSARRGDLIAGRSRLFRRNPEILLAVVRAERKTRDEFHTCRSRIDYPSPWDSDVRAGLHFNFQTIDVSRCTRATRMSRGLRIAKDISRFSMHF